DGSRLLAKVADNGEEDEADRERSKLLALTNNIVGDADQKAGDEHGGECGGGQGDDCDGHRIGMRSTQRTALEPRRLLLFFFHFLLFLYYSCPLSRAGGVGGVGMLAVLLLYRGLGGVVLALRDLGAGTCACADFEDRGRDIGDIAQDEDDSEGNSDVD